MFLALESGFTKGFLLSIRIDNLADGQASNGDCEFHVCLFTLLGLYPGAKAEVGGLPFSSINCITIEIFDRQHHDIAAGLYLNLQLLIIKLANVNAGQALVGEALLSLEKRRAKLFYLAIRLIDF